MKTLTKTETCTHTHWPPISHYYDRVKYPNGVKDGDEALCGAKLCGINNPDPTWPACRKCIEIARRNG